MSSSVREIKEGKQEQGTEEIVPYTLTVPTSWGTPTGTPTVKAYSYDGTYTDVTSTVFPSGSASINGQVISLPLCGYMTADTEYRVEIKFTVSQGGAKEAYGWIVCKR